MNNLKSTMIQGNVIDTLKVNDTINTINFIPLIPSAKINSEEGAIIPKQVLQASIIVPATTIKKEENSNLAFYLFIVLGVLAFILLFKFFNRKIKKNKS